MATVEKMKNKKNPRASAGHKESEFDATELAKGIKHEMEHTDDPAVAKQIAMDHLVETPDYYAKLEACNIEKNPPAMVQGKRQEKKWMEAKQAVSKSRGYSSAAFNEQDWGLVNKIFQEKLKKKNPTENSWELSVNTVKTKLSPKQKSLLLKMTPFIDTIIENGLGINLQPQSNYIGIRVFSKSKEYGILEVVQIGVSNNRKVIVTSGRNWGEYLDLLRESGFSSDPVEKFFTVDLVDHLKGEWIE